jgi:hypothetical protein
MVQHQYTYPTVVELRPEWRTAIRRESVITRFTELIEELLDAHSDTLSFEEPDIGGVSWAAHLDYLKDLQRVAQQSLARLTSVEA